VGVLAAAGTAAFAALLSNVVRCIDSGPFYAPVVLAWAAGGTGLLAAGSSLVGSRRTFPGAALVLVGLVVLAYAVAGPPYKSCGQFLTPF